MNDPESASQTSQNQEAHENEAYSDAENAEDSVEIENEVSVSVVRGDPGILKSNYRFFIESTPQQNALPEVSPETQITEGI